MKKNPSTCARNKKAFHDYEMLDSFEAGIGLEGWEVKSIRAGNANMKGSHIVDRGGELWIVGMHIGKYAFSQDEMPALRDRKVFLHRRTIDRLIAKQREPGIALIPTRLYIKNNRLKVEVAIMRGKKQYDKKNTLKNRDQEREKAREVKRYFG